MYKSAVEQKRTQKRVIRFSVFNSSREIFGADPI